MASRTGGVLQDQNLNVHYNEASVGWETNVAKAPPKRGGLGGRTPLGDLSNSLKPSFNQTSKKHNSSVFSFPEKQIGTSNVALDVSKKKSTTKGSTKVQKSGVRRALSDISNSAVPRGSETTKKSQNAKLSVVAEERIHPSAIAEEQFLHNHDDCIKAQTRAMDLDQALQILGLNNDYSSNPRTIPVSSKEDESSLKHLELEEMSEDLFEDYSCKYQPPYNPDSSACGTPVSPKNSLRWDDEDYVNFKLMASPELPKY